LGSVQVGPSLLKLFLDIFIFFWTVGLLLFNRYDFIHAHEESVFFCMILKPIFRFKLIYDMHSSLPQQLTNFQFTKSKLLIRLFKMLEDKSLRAADYVITICPDLSNYVNSLLTKTDKHILIENSIFEPVKLLDENTVTQNSPKERNFIPESEEIVPTGRKYIVYAGTLETYQGIGLLIKAFKKVITEVSQAFLIVVGGNKAQVDHYLELAKRYGIERNILFTGQVPQEIAKKYNALANVLVSPRIAGTNTPLKIYELIESGIALVATRIYSHTQILDDSVAILVEIEANNMAQGLIKALSPTNETLKIIENAKKLYMEKYSRPVYVKKMIKVLAHLN
jgi:glycosyltransferase involved in cell wall biosynthesis